MSLSEQQIKQIKEQLLQQIKNFPPQQKEAAEKQIKKMDAEQLEEFLIQNKLIKSSEDLEQQVGSGSPNPSQCIFCSIAKGDIQAFKIDETNSAVAVLELNPVSKGHTIIIPNKHAEADKISKTIYKFAEKISKKISSELKPKKIDILPSAMFGHGIINVLPVYKDETINSEREKASEPELQELKNKLEKKQEIKIKNPKKFSNKKLSDLPQVPKRFP